MTTMCKDLNWLTSSNLRLVRSLRAFLILMTCMLAAEVCWSAKVESLAQVRKIYVGSIGNGKGATQMRDRIANRLRSGGTFQLAPDAGSADAVLTGTGRIWTIGYASIGVHPSQANRQPVFDGFLSVEIQSKQGATLWSYLVTPSKFTMKPITNDLSVAS